MDIEIKPTTMNVSLSPELARFVREKVESGLYTSASEVVREALRRLLGEQNGTREPRNLTGAPLDRSRALRAVENILRLQKGQKLGGLSVEDLINEGRDP